MSDRKRARHVDNWAPDWLYDRLADRHEADKARAAEKRTRPARVKLRATGERTNFADHMRQAGRAMDGGATVLKPQMLRWNIAGRCQAPVSVERRQVVPSKRTLTIEYEVRCRKCSWCMQQRRRFWAIRAKAEIASAPGRTWFGTFTLQPSERLRVLSVARGRSRFNGIDYEAQTPETKFRDLVREINPLITDWIKRVRMQVQRRNEELEQPERVFGFRYIIVVETHKDGFPHWHLLIHEKNPNAPVLHADLREQWTHGFSHFRLADRADPRTAHYVCKYLSKTMCARVRASAFYGQTSSDIESDSLSCVDHPTTPRL